MKWHSGLFPRYLLLLCLLATIQANEEEVKHNKKKEELKVMKLPPCQSCRNLVDSFKRGMAHTARGKFEGGDAAWEEEKLRRYSHSEVRLVEIQEKLCTDVDKAEDQCHSLLEEHESAIEDWWFNKQEDIPDLHAFLCIDTLQVCCPEGHFGADCLPCPGSPGNVCNKNGKCKGDGLRKGNGTCICDKGYVGTACESCADGYYEAYRDEDKFLCSPCHSACDGGCTGVGPESCMACVAGWVMDESKGCRDVDDCASEKSPCGSNQFCINTEGSYSCWDCDKACDGCYGDGPDMCNKCAEGHMLKDEKVCVDESTWGRKAHVSTARYLTYFGLCIATCIIFQKNVSLAAVIGLCVAIYITVSEYWATHR